MPRKPRTQKKRYNRRYKRKTRMMMYKSPRTIMPQQYTTTFKYITQKTIVNVGGISASALFRSDLYDIDTAFASTACPGFTELSAMYARFRTLSMSYHFSFSNLEAFPGTIMAGFSNSQIGLTSVGITYAGNPLWKIDEIGDRIGFGIKKLKGRCSVVKCAGTKQPLYDDLYTGSTTSQTLATAGTMWLYATFLSSQVQTVGVNVTCVVTVKATLYRPTFMSA